MPSGLIDEKDGVGSWCDRLGDFREVQVHRFDIGVGKHERGPDAAGWADCAENVGPFVTAISWRWRSTATFGPKPC